MKKVIGIIIGVLLSFDSYSNEETARDLGAKFLEAVGGQNLWSLSKTIHNKAVNHHPAARLPYVQEQWYSLEQPAHHTKINNFDMNRERSFTTEYGWSKTKKSIKPFSDERLSNEIQSWHKTLYRKLKLLAINDKALRLERDGLKLSFFKNETYLGWVLLSSAGDLLKAGATEAGDSFTTFGEMTEFGPIRWPRSGQDSQGWRFEILDVELLDIHMPVDQSMPQVQSPTVDK